MPLIQRAPCFIISLRISDPAHALGLQSLLGRWGLSLIPVFGLLLWESLPWELGTLSLGSLVLALPYPNSLTLVTLGPPARLVLILMVLVSGSSHLSIHRVVYREGKALTHKEPRGHLVVAAEPVEGGSLSKAARQGQSCVFTSAPISMSSSSLWGSLALRKFVVGTFLFPGRQSVVVSS